MNNTINSMGFEADHEITAKLIKQKYKIVEIPVSYKPRTKEEGKKINFFDAIKAITKQLSKGEKEKTKGEKRINNLKINYTNIFNIKSDKKILI